MPVRFLVSPKHHHFSSDVGVIFLSSVSKKSRAPTLSSVAGSQRETKTPVRYIQCSVKHVDLLCWASNGAPTSNIPIESPRALAPPRVARCRASIQSMATDLSCFASKMLLPCRILETTTACLIAFMMSRLYPPATSVPNPTLTFRSRASRRGNGLAEKYAFDNGQWATEVPLSYSREREGGSRNVQCACTVRGVNSWLYERGLKESEPSKLELTRSKTSISSTPRSVRTAFT